MKDIKGLIEGIKNQDELMSLGDVKELTMGEKGGGFRWSRLAILLLLVGVVLISLYNWNSDGVSADKNIVEAEISETDEDSTSRASRNRTKMVQTEDKEFSNFPFVDNVSKDTKSKINPSKAIAVKDDVVIRKDTFQEVSMDTTNVVVEKTSSKQALFPTSEEFYYDNWEKEIQSFTINPRKSNVLKGNEGTIIIVPPNAICDIYEGFDAEIKLTEYYRKEDMLLAQLTTSSDGEMLESAGMIKLTAMKNGEELELCKEVTVLFPSHKYQDTGFVGFNGVWDDQHDNIDWEQIGGRNRNFFGGTVIPDCGRGEYQAVRCNWPTRRLALNTGGKSNIRKNLRDDEVILKIRHRFWFTDSVPSKLYNEVYEGIKYKMKDTLSASAYTDCYVQREKALALQLYLDSLRGGESGFDPSILNREIGYILAKVSSFGTINCDRFGSFRKVRNYTYQVGGTSGVISSRLIFHDIKSILGGSQTSRNEITFKKIPAGMTATLLVVKYIKDKMLLAHQELKIGEAPNLMFKEIDKNKLQDALRSISAGIRDN